MNAKAKGKWKYSIKTQLRVILAVLIVTPIVILGIYMYTVARKNLIQQTQIAMQGNTDVIANELESSCKRKSDIIKFFTYEENLRKTLEHAISNPYALSSELSSNIEPLIWYYLSSDSSIESIDIYSNLITEDHLGDFMHRPDTDLEKEWYDLCSKDYSTMWVTDRQGGVYVIKALLDLGSSSKLVGIVALKVKNSTFFSSINNSSYLDNGILIVDGDGTIVIHKAISNKDLDTEICKVAMGYGLDFMENDFVEGNGYFLSSSKSFDNSWKLFYYVDRAEITADVVSILISDTIIAIVLFVLAFIVASVYAGRFSMRISRLNDMAGEVRNGNFNIVDKDRYKDEIGQLSTAMVGMAGQLSAMVQEINERNEKDLQLKDNDIHYREWLFDFVVERNNDILAVLDGDSFSPSFVTSNVEDVLGIPLRDVKDDIRSLDRVLKTETTEGKNIEEVFEKCRDTGEEYLQDEIRLDNYKTGEHLYYRGIAVTTIDDGGKRTALALYDRTQEIKRNHQLQEALNAAETANKAKTSFLANMSHDFRTPMNAITGFNLLIDKHADEPEKVKEYTHKISLASQNLLSMLNDVLDMSKIESGKTTLDIKEMPIGLLLEEINSVISFQAKNKNQEYIMTIGDLQHDSW